MSVDAAWFPEIGPTIVRLIQENLTAAKCGRIDFAEQEIVEQDSHENINKWQIGVDVGPQNDLVRVPMAILTCAFLVREKDKDGDATYVPNTFDDFVDLYVEPSASAIAENADKLHLENIARSSPRLLGTFNGGGFLEWFEMVQGLISGEPIAFISPETEAELLNCIGVDPTKADGMNGFLLEDHPGIPIIVSQHVPELYTPAGAQVHTGRFGSVNVIFNRNNVHFVCRPLGKFNSHRKAFESVTYTEGNISVQVKWGPHKGATRVDINMLAGTFIPEPEDIAAILT